jgi:tetratricopeptide (TPR) repeat protein
LTSARVCFIVSEMSLRSPAARVQRHFSSREILAMYPGLRGDRLRCLERWNAVSPAYRADGESFFAFEELPVIRQVSADLGSGAPFRWILRRLQAARDGQLDLNFAADAMPAELVVLPQPEEQPLPPDAAHTNSAEEHFERAATLDDQDPAQQEEAARLYRGVLEADPRCVPALVNLANIHHARGDLVEAEALYDRAIAIDAGVAEAHFNLGNLHYDLERLERACACYDRALAIQPAFADAQFYLAVTLERLGRSDEARPHWRAYQNLAPDGEWAALAREFSE